MTKVDDNGGFGAMKECPHCGAVDFEEDAKNLKLVLEAVQKIAAAAAERDMWLVIRCEHVHVGGLYSKIRIADIKQFEEWDNGEADIFGINDSPLTEDYAGHTHFSKAEWASRRLMTTAEVLGL